LKGIFQIHYDARPSPLLERSACAAAGGAQKELDGHKATTAASTTRSRTVVRGTLSATSRHHGA
jgi:hypothetical protein